MGNAQQTNIKQKFLPLLRSKEYDEIKARLLSLCRLNISEDLFIDSFLPCEIKDTIKNNPVSIDLLIHIIIDVMYTLLNSRRQLNNDEVVNMLRILTRVIPILNEVGNEEQIKRLLWENPNYTPDEPQAEEMIGEAPVPKILVLKANPNFETKRDNDLMWSYGIKLAKIISELMFYPGFTISTDFENNKLTRTPFFDLDVRTDILWCPFMNNKKGLNLKKEFIENRIALLQCILACISMPLFRRPNDLYHQINPFLLFFISQKNTYINEFIISLLNIIVSFEENGYLPYSGIILRNPRYQTLGTLSAQVLSILLQASVSEDLISTKIKEVVELQEIYDYYIEMFESQRMGRSQERKNLNQSRLATECSEIFSNACTNLLSKLCDSELIDFFIKNLTRIVRNPIDCKETFFPGSGAEVNFQEETLFIFWKLIENSKVFQEKLINEKNFGPFFKVFMQIFNQSIAEGHKSGVFHVCLCILSKLSTDRNFSVSLKKPLPEDYRLENIPIVIGAYYDIVYVMICYWIIVNSEKKIHCYPNNLISILMNISPYVMNPAKITCIKLIHLLKLFTSYPYLLQEQINVYSLIKLLKIFDNILVYHGETAHNLLFFLWKKEEDFRRIPKLMITEKILKFFSQNNWEQVLQEQKDEMANKSNLSIQGANKASELKREEEERHKFTQEQREEEKSEDIKKNPENFVTDLKLVTLDWQYVIKWFETVKRDFPLANALNVIEFLCSNLKKNTIPQEHEEEAVLKIVKDKTLIGYLNKKTELLLDYINDFTFLNNVFHSFLWKSIIEKNNRFPYFDLCEAATLNSIK